MLIPVLLLCAFQTLHVGADERNFGQERVVENVLQNYGDSQRLVRPVRNTSCDVSIILSAVKHFDLDTGRATFSVLLKQSWTDPRLSWGDSDAVSSLYLPPSSVWRPDLRLYDSLDYNAKIADDTLVLFRPEGAALWVPPAEFTVVCLSDDDDWWRCQLRIGSWVHTAAQIKIGFFEEQHEVNTEYYNENSYGFEVESEPGSVVVKKYACCPEPYSSANFVLKIRRVPEGRASVSSAVSTRASCVAMMVLLLAYATL